MLVPLPAPLTPPTKIIPKDLTNMATTVNILPEAIRGDLAYGHVGDPHPAPFSMAAGAPNLFTLSFPSTDWTDVLQQGTLHMDCTLQRSLDSGVTWLDFGGFGGAENTPSKGTGTTITAPAFAVQWDGTAMLLRGTVNVSAPFSWGISLTIGDTV